MCDSGAIVDIMVDSAANVTSSRLILVSPLQGWSAPLDEAPDPVFAGRMLGDGLAIDPTGHTLHAPCAGILIGVPATRHAVTLRAGNGAEVLLHIGIDTVGLGGEGFELHVREGQRVEPGDRLISFDLDFLARRAKSVLTPVLLTGGSGITITRRNQDRRVEAGEFLLELQAADPSAVLSSTSVDVLRSGSAAVPGLQRTLVVQAEHGIHARPAALIAGSIKSLSAEVSVRAGGRTANARSPVALMSLGIRRGERITISASGRDARPALLALEQSILALLDKTEPDSASGRSRTQRAADAIPTDADNTPHGTELPGGSIPGVVANRGLAAGAAFRLAHAELQVSEAGVGAVQERADLEAARAAVGDQLRRAIARERGAARSIAEAHLELIDDPELLDRAAHLIALGKSAGFAWRSALREAIQVLRSLNQSRMRERADDLLDLESRVLAALGGQPTAQAELPPESIVIADELLPSQLTALDPRQLAGICLVRGGPTSHVAIMAAAMDVPMLVAMGPRLLRVATGTSVVLDGEAGLLQVAPSAEEWERARQRLTDRRLRQAAVRAAAQRESRTADGTRVEVFANVGSATEAQLAVRNGAEGCGLLRTEFLFLERQSAPDAAEQTQQYQQIAHALGSRPLTIRTLDVGGDKPIPYLPLPHEDNPALGLRGIRTSLWRPDLLRQQLEAILQVRPSGQCRILLPMITDPQEIRAVRRILGELTAAAADPAIALGAMIETPASALMAERIGREVDFLSIGTNDLTQYTLAMDRGQPDLAARLDGLHPAVLRLIATTTEGAGRHGRHVAVCGGLASDAAAVPILIGLGVNELSMVPAVIPALKSLIAGLRVDQCVALAAAALEQESAAAVRALVRERITELQATEGAPEAAR